jgi:hypothetical protein
MTSRMLKNAEISSFQGAGKARDPGIHEHAPERSLAWAVFMGSGSGPGRPSRNDTRALQHPARRVIIFVVIASLVAARVASSLAADLPVQVGECVNTSIKSVETRLTDGSTGRPVPGSGSAVTFANGGYQVDYDTVPAIEQSRPGDPVRMCLVQIPKKIVQRETTGVGCIGR